MQYKTGFWFTGVCAVSSFTSKGQYVNSKYNKLTNDFTNIRSIPWASILGRQHLTCFSCSLLKLLILKFRYDADVDKVKFCATRLFTLKLARLLVSRDCAVETRPGWSGGLPAGQGAGRQARREGDQPGGRGVSHSSPGSESTHRKRRMILEDASVNLLSNYIAIYSHRVAALLGIRIMLIWIRICNTG